jgi:hypothetical protein
MSVSKEQRDMSENFRCGDPEALITYLYDEGDTAEREAIAAHVMRCPSCTDEIESLRSTRVTLSAWSPPDASLGFRVTRADERPEPVVLRPAAWWRQPLPAWAQAAAAVLIFAAGMTLGGVRQPAPAAPVAEATRVAAPPAGAAPASARNEVVSPTPAQAAVSRDELVRLEQRLRALEASGAAAMRTQTVASRVSADDRALLQQVQALIDASEERQRRENITLVGRVVNDLDLQRRVDLRQIEDRFGRLHDTTGVALRQQNDAVNYLMRVSQTNVPAGR